MEQLAKTFDFVGDHAGLSVAFVVFWIVVLIGSLWAVRYFLIKIPPDFFAGSHRPLDRWRTVHPVLRWTLLIVKNLLGAVLFAAGMIMIFTPGQGVLAILFGISLLDIPGKRALERRIIQQPKVLAVVNRLRAKADRAPLVFDGAETGGE